MTVVFPVEIQGADSIVKGLDAIGQAARKAASSSAASASKAEAAQTKSAAKIAATAEKTAAKQIAAAEKAATKAVSAAEKADAKIMASTKRRLEKESRMAERNAKAQAKAQRELHGKIDDRRASMAGGLAMGVGGLALGALGVGASVVGAAGREAFGLDEQARRISISARQPGTQAVDPTLIREEMEQIAIRNKGTKAQDVGAGIGGFVTKTGDLDSALRYADLFAKVAAATGSSFEEISSVGADLQNNLKVDSLSGMETAMQSLMIQGKKGAIEFGDMAKAMAKPLGAASAFGGFSKEEGTAKVGGLMQLAKLGGASSAEDSATSVARIFSGLSMETKRLDAAGVKTRDKQGNARDIESILTDTIGKVGGNDMTKKMSGLNAIFGAEAIKTMNPLITTFQKTFSGTKGTDAEKRAAAEKAVRAQLEENMTVYKGSGEIMKDAALAMASPSAQLETAWQQLVSTVGAELIPALAENAESISTMATDLIPLVADGLQVFIGTVEATADTLGGFADAVESSSDALAEALGIDTTKKTERSETRAMVRGSQKELREADFAIAKAGGEDKATPDMIARREDAKASLARWTEADKSIGTQQKREARQTGNAVVDTAITTGLSALAPGLGGLGAAVYTGYHAPQRVDQGNFTNQARKDAETDVAAAKSADAMSKQASQADAVTQAFQRLADAADKAGPAIERNGPVKK